MNPEPGKLVPEFARRTRANLEAIRSQRAQGADVFEVTQLINSLLGLLVMPQQRYYDYIPPTLLAQLKAEGWPVPSVVGAYPQVRDLRQLVRYLRNAVAHFNLELIADEHNEIVALELWNTDVNRETKKREITWRARLTLGDLEGLTTRFVDLILASSTDSARDL